MKPLQIYILFLLLFTVSTASTKNLLSKELFLEGKQNKTICISGDSSVLKLWSYRVITISSNWGDIKLNINSYDSSIIQYIFHFFNDRVFSYFSDSKWYDVYSQQDSPTNLFISPYGRTCISLGNPYSKNEYPMKVIVQIEKRVSFLYPCIFVCSCLLFVYSRLLCTTSSFYYIFFIISSPIMMPLYLSGYLVNALIQKKTVSFGINGISLMIYVRYLFQHSIYLILSTLILQHPISTFIYILICYIVSFCVISSQLNRITKKEIQIVYTLLRFICVVFIVNATASVTVALCTVIVLVFLGFVTQKLKWSNLLKEVELIRRWLQPSETVTISLDVSDVERIRYQLQKLKLSLQMNTSVASEISSVYIQEYSLFLHSDRLYIPSSSFLVYITQLLHSHKTSPIVLRKPIESDTILLEETTTDYPFFPPQPTLSSFTQKVQSIPQYQPILPPDIGAYPSNSYTAPIYNQTTHLDNTFYQAFGPSNNDYRYRNM